MASTINASNASSGGIITTADASGQLELQTANTTRLAIDVNGNVGIGTVSPSTYNGLLNVKGSDRSVIAYFGGTTYAGRFGANSSFATIEGVDAATGVSSYQPLQMGGSILSLATGGSERMRIDASGNVMAGTTVPTNPNPGIAMLPAAAASINIGHANGSASGTAFISFLLNGAGIGFITQNGTTAVAYNTSSDYRLKKDVTPMVGALDKVAALKPVTYKWKTDGSDGQGFIAHELQEIIPDCVTGKKDAVDADGNPVYQGIDTSFLVATLVAAIQELTARVAALEAK